MHTYTHSGGGNGGGGHGLARKTAAKTMYGRSDRAGHNMRLGWDTTTGSGSEYLTRSSNDGNGGQSSGASVGDELRRQAILRNHGVTGEIWRMNCVLSLHGAIWTGYIPVSAAVMPIASIANVPDFQVSWRSSAA